MSNKDKYTRHCLGGSLIPIFSQPWWLDCVTEKSDWDVCIIERDGKIIASMPYILKRKFGLLFCEMPCLTQTLGPWIAPSTAKYSKQLAQQKTLTNELIEQLPEYSFFMQKWHYSQNNWLAFYWKGFHQTTHYTYVIEDLSNLDEVWSNFQSNIKSDIKKASNRFELIIDDKPTINDFFKLNKKVFSRQDVSQPYSEEFIVNLDASCKKNNAGKIFIAVDSIGRRHSGVYLIWDKNSAYYLMGGGDPELRNSGATSLCLWEAIKFASTVTNKFDFEGSMIEPVERFFRAFGAKQTPYFAITKTTSILLKLRQVVRLLKGS